MIKHLNGDYETVEYPENHFTILYDNNVKEDYPFHWHNAVEIIMPLRNNFFVSTNERKFSMQERDILIIPPGELHSMTAPDEGQRIIFQCNNSMLGDIDALSSLTSVLTETIFINSTSDDTLKTKSKKIMLDIYDEYFSHSELSEIKIYLKLLELFVTVRESQISEQKNQLRCTSEKMFEYNERFNSVIKYIDKNYMYEITLDKLASIAGYSRYHFSRIFKQYSGLSYVTYINKTRINAAMKLLMDPSKSITEVAMNSGFSSITSFNRAFKEIKHCTPSEFKKFYRH